MRYFPSVKRTIKTTVSVLLTGVLWLSLSAAKTETTIPTRGSAQQLEGVRGRNWSEWSWGVGGQATDLADDSEVDLVYELTNHSGWNWEVQTRSEDWINLHRGDTSQGSVRTPIVRF